MHSDRDTRTLSIYVACPLVHCDCGHTESMESRPPLPHRLEAEPPADELFEFSERVAVTVLNYMCVAILEAEEATRLTGEQRMQGTFIAV